jgi:hypothetical protein
MKLKCLYVVLMWAPFQKMLRIQIQTCFLYSITFDSINTSDLQEIGLPIIICDFFSLLNCFGCVNYKGELIMRLLFVFLSTVEQTELSFTVGFFAVIDISTTISVVFWCNYQTVSVCPAYGEECIFFETVLVCCKCSHVREHNSIFGY